MRAMIAPAIAVLVALTAAPAAQRQLATRTVLATVTDAGSHPVVGLGPDDFVIEEGGGAREVFDVRAADYPVVILLDNGGDAADAEAIRRAATGFVTRLGTRAVAVGALTDPPALSTFEDEHAVISTRIEALPLRSGAALNPAQAISEAVRVVESNGGSFAAIVVLLARPFEPAASDTSGVLGDVFRSRSIVHVVSRHPRLGANENARSAGQLLYELADQTGGHYTTVYAAASYGSAMERVADRLATEMLVEYLVAAENEGGRDVRVGVRVPGARVRGLGVFR